MFHLPMTIDSVGRKVIAVVVLGLLSIFVAPQLRGQKPVGVQQKEAGSRTIQRSNLIEAQPRLQHAPFAQPWNITFAHISDAMEKGDYSLQQIRRVREVILNEDGSSSKDSGWVGVREKLEHLGSLSGPHEDARFHLQFIGVEGSDLSPQQVQRKRDRFVGYQEFTFRFQSFRVSDADQAQENYTIYFLSNSERIGRLAYRVAVIPKNMDRSAWLLDLDQLTGYPLYRGEYDLAEDMTATLISEVEVTSMVWNPRFGQAAPPWWQPSASIEDFSSPSAALGTAFSNSRTSGSIANVIPGPVEMPQGYQFSFARVSTSPFSGERTGVLVYSDGIDELFVLQGKPSPGSDLAPTDGQKIYIRREAGVVTCHFTIDGVQYKVIGRSSGDLVRSTAASIYRRAIGN